MRAIHVPGGPDALPVSGATPGAAAEMRDLAAVQRALPKPPVLAITGVKHATIAEVLRQHGYATAWFGKWP